MSKKEFARIEKKLVSLLEKSAPITWDDNTFEITNVAKPSSSKGEPKTDIFFQLKNTKCSIEIKISIKLANADFLENKIKAERAESILGENWKNIIENCTNSIKDNFEDRDLIFMREDPKKIGLTLGWKYEFLNKKSGKLSNIIDVDIKEVYKGLSLDDDKKNAIINGTRIKNSGIADYILLVNNIDDYSSAQDILNNIMLIDTYIDKYDPKIYFACKAQNYFPLKQPKKHDGDRPFCVYVNWSVVDGKLSHELIYSNPLLTKGNEVAKKLECVLSQLEVCDESTLRELKVMDPSVIKR